MLQIGVSLFPRPFYRVAKTEGLNSVFAYNFKLGSYYKINTYLYNKYFKRLWVDIRQVNEMRHIKINCNTNVLKYNHLFYYCYVSYLVMH